MRSLLACVMGFSTAAFASGVQETQTVRVAAIQCSSVMGKTEENVKRLTNLVYSAAAQGAKIVVMPECSVQGYVDPNSWSSWTTSKSDSLFVGKVAETVPGPSTEIFGRIAGELKIYICVSLVEAGSNEYYNSQVLLSPEGKVVGHHRKKNLWTPGDSTWCTPGKLGTEVVKTEYGNLGLMICFDFHKLPPFLARKKADIVLYSVGWYGPNEKVWFTRDFPARAVKPYGYHLVSANWSTQDKASAWPGAGYSCVIRSDGSVVAMAKTVVGDEIVLAELQVVVGK